MSLDAKGPNAEGLIVKLLAPRDPSPVRLFVFALLMMAWLVLLIILYVTTVRPKSEHTPVKAVARLAGPVWKGHSCEVCICATASRATWLRMYLS